MKLSLFDAASKLFIGYIDAINDQLNPGGYLIPADATAVAPPPLQTTQAARFNGTDWDVVPDLRGTEYWLNDAQFTITDAGVDLPDGATLQKPQSVINAEFKAVLDVALVKIEAKAGQYQMLFLGANSSKREARFAQNLAAAQRLLAGNYADPEQQSADTLSMTVQAQAQANKNGTTPMSVAEFAQWIVAWQPKTTVIAGYIESILVNGRTGLQQLRDAAVTNRTAPDVFAAECTAYLDQLANQASAKFAELTGASNE
ncbi:MAG: hypothetical protein BWK73_04655 [Thiothrix lacustris]|uniref:Uncharacterized protein n=1 Tax=Thiothrix lacustris TaxID=525917 RepID=A0A1Y1QXM5_9GAMM|nr:MAG: hypothetical protein BWK73_04655 [Thiothrix lacustris]